jgi:phosphoglucosamine mutase
LEKLGIKTEQTAVGDRFVYERMQSGDFSLGGEQSGHIILKKYATTGDGLLTAIMMTEEICDSKTSLSKLCEEVTLYPQYIKNIRVKNKEQAISAPAVLKEKESIEKQLCGKGRVLLRKSGTEPCIRIMVECEEETKCEEYSNRIAQKLLEGGHALD